LIVEKKGGTILLLDDLRKNSRQEKDYQIGKGGKNEFFYLNLTETNQCGSKSNWKLGRLFRDEGRSIYAGLRIEQLREKERVRRTRGLLASTPLIYTFLRVVRGVGG